MKVTRESLFAGHRRCAAPASASATSATRCRRTPRATATRWCGSSWATGSAPASTRSRRCPNYGPPGRRERLVPGMCLAIEPMVNVGGPEVEVLADGWTAVTRDRQPLRALRALGGGDAASGPGSCRSRTRTSRRRRRMPEAAGGRRSRWRARCARRCRTRSSAWSSRPGRRAVGDRARGGRVEPAAAAARGRGGGGDRPLRRGARPHREAAVAREWHT